MSANRRSGNEESILAMLERDGGRRPRPPVSRLALYGVSGLLGVALAGALVWLARDGGNSPEVVVPQAAEESGPPAVQASAQPAQSATIVDEPQPPSAPPQQQDAAPMVLLPQPPAQAAVAGDGTTGEQMAAARVAETTPQVPLTPNPVGQAQPRHAARAEGSHQEHARAHMNAKASVGARVASLHRPTRQQARLKKQAASEQAAEPVDSDVALISAVIQHASNHELDCAADGTCAAKTTPQQ